MTYKDSIGANGEGMPTESDWITPTFRDSIRELETSSKFEGAMRPRQTAILYNVVMDGFSDDSTSDDNGIWCDRIGRFIIVGNDRGFVWSWREASAQVAQERFAQIDRELNPDPEEIFCPECGDVIWDTPTDSKLAKCWNGAMHPNHDYRPLAFDTMGDSE